MENQGWRLYGRLREIGEDRVVVGLVESRDDENLSRNI